MMSLWAAGEADMEALGLRFAKACDGGAVIYLQGGLGTGKTTFTRGLCHCLGYAGFVKSPTFALVESYLIGTREVHHFDLYRVTEPEELEFIGIRDFFTPEALCIVEWPERGAGWLPEGDVVLAFAYVSEGRRVDVTAGTAKGRQILGRLSGIQGDRD